MPSACDHGTLVLLEHLRVGAMHVAEVRNHLLARSTSALLELLRGVVVLFPFRPVELLVEHVHHVAQAVRVVGEVGEVDVPEHIASVAFRRKEDQACDVLVFGLVRMLDRCDLASPLLVLARVQVRSTFEEGDIDVWDPGVGVAVLLASKRRRVGNAVVMVSIRGITFFRLTVRVGATGDETFCVTTLSNRWMSYAFPSSHLEVWVDLMEVVLQVVEEEDVASRGPGG